MGGMEILDPVHPRPGRGGRRPNAGSKPGLSGKKIKEKVAELLGNPDAESSPEDSNAAYASYAVQRARSEKAKADLAELDYKVKSGLYVERAAVRQANATAFATIAQTMRSIPDNLERMLGVSPEVAAAVGESVDNALADLADSLEMLSGPDD